jgi:hypothetical protein
MVDSIQGLRPDSRLITMGADAEPLSISLMDLMEDKRPPQLRNRAASVKAFGLSSLGFLLS